MRIADSLVQTLGQCNVAGKESSKDEKGLRRGDVWTVRYFVILVAVNWIYTLLKSHVP